MTQTSEQSAADLNRPVSLPDAPVVEVTKEFHAPVEEVWKAWSDAELIKQWWGPEGFSAPEAKTDFQVDGKYLFAMKDPDGQVMYTTGIYREIFENKMLVYTDIFADENGVTKTPSEAGMENWEGDGVCLVSVKFDQTGDTTKVQLVHEGIPENQHDDCVQGWSSSLDKMKRLVEKH